MQDGYYLLQNEQGGEGLFTADYIIECVKKGQWQISEALKEALKRKIVVNNKNDKVQNVNSRKDIDEAVKWCENVIKNGEEHKNYFPFYYTHDDAGDFVPNMYIIPRDKKELILYISDKLTNFEWSVLVEDGWDRCYKGILYSGVVNVYYYLRKDLDWSHDDIKYATLKLVGGRNLTNCDSLFFNYGDGDLPIKLDLSLLDTSKVTSMRGMFSNSMFETLVVKNLDTSKVTNMSCMFEECYYYEEIWTRGYYTWRLEGKEPKGIDLSFLNTSNVINMRGMFFKSHFTEIDLSSLDTSKVTDTSLMFYECDNLQKLKLNNNFDIDEVTKSVGSKVKIINC